MRTCEDGERVLFYKLTKKAHMKMMNKVFTSLYLCLEHLKFLVKSASWTVTKMHSHFTFEQERLKKDFVIINQKSRQKP